MLQQHGLSPGLALVGQHGPVAGVLGQVDSWAVEHGVNIFQESDFFGERRKIGMFQSLSGRQPLLGLKEQEGC